jgi:hypothetical protein
MKQIQNTERIFISRRELSERLGISLSTSQRLDKAGIIHPVKMGGTVRYHWESTLESLQKKNSY